MTKKYTAVLADVNVAWPDGTTFTVEALQEAAAQSNTDKMWVGDGSGRAGGVGGYPQNARVVGGQLLAEIVPLDAVAPGEVVKLGSDALDFSLSGTVIEQDGNIIRKMQVRHVVMRPKRRRKQ